MLRLLFRRVLRMSRGTCRCNSTKVEFVNRRKRLLIPTGLLLSAQGIQSSDKNSITDKLSGVDPSSLSHSFLLKNASSCTVDYAVVLLNRTVMTMLDIEEKYRQSMTVLINLIEKCLEIQGDENEDHIWQAIIATRAKVNQYKETRTELTILMNTVERLLLAASEASFLTGAEQSSFTANQLLNDSRMHLERVQRSSSAVESQLAEAEVRMIEHTSNHENEEMTESSDRQNTSFSQDAENTDGENTNNTDKPKR